MLRLLMKPAAFAVLALAALTLAGCADIMGSGKPDPSFATASKSYDKALTADQQKAAISDLQSEQAKRQQEAAAKDDTTTSAKPAQN